MNELIFVALYFAAWVLLLLGISEIYCRVSWWWSMRQYRRLQWRRMQEAIDVKNDKLQM